MKFYLGAPVPKWLSFSPVSLFVSTRRLRDVVSLPRATTSWACDSGGFTELNLYGRWTTTPKQYISELRRYRDEIGNMDWAAQQDWMCEDVVLHKTGYTLRRHQVLTVENYLELRDLDPSLPIIPVIQGITIADYERCIEMFYSAGVDLAALPRVGIGSVCRRQNTKKIEFIIKRLARHKLRLHGFGVKTTGLRLVGEYFASADSMAWSKAALWNRIRLAGHTHETCTNCFDFASIWRTYVLDRAGIEPCVATHPDILQFCQAMGLRTRTMGAMPDLESIDFDEE